MRTDTNLHWWETLNDAYDASDVWTLTFQYCLWMVWE